MPDEQKSVEDIKSGIKKTLSQLPASDWTDNTGVYDYLKILNTSRELFDVLAEGILQALSKDPSVNPEVVNSIVEDRVANSRVADFKPANPDTTVSDKFGGNKVVDTDFIYTLINRYNHVLDLLDNLVANGALVKGIKSVKQNLTLLADRQDSMVDLDPILESVNTAIDDIKKTATDKTDAAQADADKALAAVTSDNISKTITDLISSGKIKVDDTLDPAVKKNFTSINKGSSWSKDSNDLSNVSRTVIDNSTFGVNLLTDEGTIFKSYSPDTSSQNYINLFRSDFTDAPIKIPNSGVNIDPGVNYVKRVQLWAGKVPELAGRDDKSIANLSYSSTDSTIQGLQFGVTIEKRLVTAGVTADTYTNLPVVSSLSNEPQKGKYVCTVPVPLSIAKSNFNKSSDTFEIPLSGIGEGLSIAKVTQAPFLTLSYTYDSKKNTISFVVNASDGYALDSTSGKNNGALYSPKILFVRSYAVEKSSSDSELPNGTVLWKGWQNSTHEHSGVDVRLSSVNSGFSNVGSGIKIHFVAPYLLNVNFFASGNADSFYDGSLKRYQDLKGGHAYYADPTSHVPSYYEPLPQGTIPARTFLNLSSVDEYGNAASDDWLIIPKEFLMEGYTVSLLEDGFFPGFTPILDPKNPSAFDPGSNYLMSADQFNDPKGIVDFKAGPYLSLSGTDLVPKDFDLTITFKNFNYLHLQGGLERYNNGSSRMVNKLISIRWYRAKDHTHDREQLAYVALFAIDRVVTYKV